MIGTSPYTVDPDSQLLVAVGMGDAKQPFSAPDSALLVIRKLEHVEVLELFHSCMN